jgi:hypothetical protein
MAELGYPVGTRWFLPCLMEKDPGFGGLVRVQNKRQEFL